MLSSSLRPQHPGLKPVTNHGQGPSAAQEHNEPFVKDSGRKTAPSGQLSFSYAHTPPFYVQCQ